MRIFLLIAVGVMLVALAVAQTNQSTELQPGQPAPNFDLLGSDGKRYALDQFRGRQAVVLAWFPKAHTGGCTQECKALRDSAQALEKFNVAIFAASVDQPEANKSFAEDLELNYPILSDPSHETARAYGVLKGLPVAARHTIYIGKDGKVLRVDRDIRVASAGQDMQKQLEELGVEKRY